MQSFMERHFFRPDEIHTEDERRTVMVTVNGSVIEATEVQLVLPGGSVGATTNDQPTYVEYTYRDGTVVRDWK